MHRKLNQLISILYPKRCAGCDECIPSDTLICPACARKLLTISGPTCIKCGKKLTDEDRLYCMDCSRKIHVYTRGFAVFEYETIRHSLYKFKYSGRAEYAEYYASVTAKMLGDTFKQLGIEAFIPVPIHKSRENKRGYNQALEYARALSSQTQIPVLDDLIIRTKKTNPLKEMGPQARQKNLKKAFKLRKIGVRLTRVCVVDDIYTTGATIDEIAGMLKMLEIPEIYFVTIAIGNGL